MPRLDSRAISQFASPPDTFDGPARHPRTAPTLAMTIPLAVKKLPTPRCSSARAARRNVGDDWLFPEQPDKVGTERQWASIGDVLHRAAGPHIAAGAQICFG